MRKRLVMAAAALVAGAAAGLRPAQAYEAPWCAVIDFGRGGAYWDCQYQSLQQCAPVALAGSRGFCNPNPAYVGPSPARKAKNRHRRPARR